VEHSKSLRYMSTLRLDLQQGQYRLG